MSRHGDGVRGAGGDPNGAMDGHDPCAWAGGYGHDAAGRKDELIAIVEMHRDGMSGGVIEAQCHDGSPASRQGREDGGLSFSRHSLTEYRMRDERANTYGLLVRPKWEFAHESDSSLDMQLDTVAKGA